MHFHSGDWYMAEYLFALRYVRTPARLVMTT